MFFFGFDPWFLAFGLVFDLWDGCIFLHVGPFYAGVEWGERE